MKDLQQNIRLTDELERQLMLRAIEEQFRFRPSVALKNLAAKVTGLFSHGHGRTHVNSAH